MEARTSDWQAIRRAATDGVAVLPMGSLEAHGPHLPCGTDSILVEAIVARAIADADGRRVVVFPTVDYSVVEWARPLASAGVSPARLVGVLVDVAGDIHRLGFRKIVFVNGHANLPAAQLAVWQLRQEGLAALYVDCCPYLMAADAAGALVGEPLGHAGLIETALMLAAAPDRVDMSRAPAGPADLWGADFPFATLRRPGVFCVPSIAALPDGVEGGAARADAAVGEKLLAAYAGALAEMLNDLLAGDVPPGFLETFRKDIDG